MNYEACEEDQAKDLRILFFQKRISLSLNMNFKKYVYVFCIILRNSCYWNSHEMRKYSKFLSQGWIGPPSIHPVSLTMLFLVGPPATAIPPDAMPSYRQFPPDKQLLPPHTVTMD